LKDGEERFTLEEEYLPWRNYYMPVRKGYTGEKEGRRKKDSDPSKKF